MAKTSWFDDKAGTEQIQDRVRKLETFTNALADGVISKQELEGQEKRLVEAMKTAEALLNDDQHAKVTTVLVELTAYNIMRLLHELQSERAKMAVR
jgi:predicted transcriptional regulator